MVLAQRKTEAALAGLLVATAWASAGRAGEAAGGDTHALIVSGLPGSPVYARRYRDWATRFRKVFYYGPLYPYFLALVYGICGHHYEAAHVAQFAVGALTAGVVFLGASQWFSRRVALGAGLLAALCPEMLFYESTLLPASITTGTEALRAAPAATSAAAGSRLSMRSPPARAMMPQSTSSPVKARRFPRVQMIVRAAVLRSTMMNAN